MADEITPEEEPKKGGMLKWIIIGVVVIALGVGGYFAYTMFFAAPADDANATKAEDAKKGEETLSEGKGPLVPLPIFLVNLSDPLGRRYLKLGVEVQVRDEKIAAELSTNEARIKDAMLLLLSSKTYDSLSSLKAKIELKSEIVERLNQVLGNGSVLKVFITEMVIQ